VKLKKKFIKQLRKEYHKLDTPLWDCFEMYIGFLDALGCEYLCEMNQWQMDDYRAVIENPKTMWHRNRRAGKTLGLSVLAVFFAIINFGYRANQGKVLWRAPSTTQLAQAEEEWLPQNPFVIWINSEHDVGVLKSKTMDLACLSAGKAVGKGAAVLIEDEYRDVYKGLKMYDIAGRCEDVCAEGSDETRRFISASTGCRLTYFHNQFLSGEWAYCRHTWQECISNDGTPWITEKYVESKRKEHPEDPYFVDQEFNSMWVARGDTAYRNIYIIDTKAKTITHNESVYRFGEHPFFPLEWEFPKARNAGVDFNDTAGHYIVVGSIDDEAIYINSEHVVQTIAALKPFGRKYKMEIESGPFDINIQNARKCIKQRVHCTHRNWDKDVIAERFRISMDKMIVIDRHRAAKTLTDFEEAVTDENARESKLKKNTHQHGLDGAFHMIHRLGNDYIDEDRQQARDSNTGSEYINELIKQSKRRV